MAINEPNEGYASQDTELEDILVAASRRAEEGEEASALELLLSVEPEHPDDAHLLCMVGALGAQLGADGMAVDFFHRCLAQNPRDPQLLVTAGAGLAAAGDPAAEAALRLAVLSAPEMPSARMHYGRYLVRSGLVAQGLEELTAASKLDPDDAEVRGELGIGLLLDGRAAQALDELEAGVTLAPDDVDARLLFGLALVQRGDLSRAAEEMHPLATSLVDDGEVQLLLALVFAAEGWEEQAWLALSTAEAAAQPGDPEVIREVEEALEAGDEAVRAMLVDEIAPSALRERIYRG